MGISLEFLSLISILFFRFHFLSLHFVISDLFLSLFLYSCPHSLSISICLYLYFERDKRDKAMDEGGSEGREEETNRRREEWRKREKRIEMQKEMKDGRGHWKGGTNGGKEEKKRTTKE